jgi:tetratricopeptide (TPR) repeat protein
MLSTAQTVGQALEFHRRGDLHEAEKLYRQVLETNPRHADAWHLLGLVAQARGEAATALEYIGRAIKLDGGQAMFHNHLGEVHRTIGQLAEAEQCCRRALALSGDFAPAHHTLGMVHQQQGRFEEAVVSFRRAVEIDPRFAAAQVNMASALAVLGRRDEAVARCRAALAADPRLLAAHQMLGRLLREEGKTAEAIDFYRHALAADPTLAAAECCLGTLLQAESRFAEAIQCYRRAVAIEPNFAEAHCNLGSALAEIGKPAEAEVCYQRALQLNPRLAEVHYNLGLLTQARGEATAAIEYYRNTLRLKPDCAPAYNNLGMVYRTVGNMGGAKECYAKALELVPDFAEALNNLGNLLKAEGRVVEARVAYERAARINPQHAQARCNLALLRLAEGDYETGWREYEFRRGCPEYHKRAFEGARWQGEPLDGRTLFVNAEQGLGDTLQFIRYLPLVARGGGKVLCEVQRGLLPLVRQSGFGEYAELVAKESPPGSYDLHVAMLSLPGIFGTTIDTIPAAEGYLAADPKLVEHWRGVLGDRPRRRIGICWQGSFSYLGDELRSIGLAEFAPLAIEGVELVSLQKGFGSEQLAKVDFPVRDLGPDFDEGRGAFMDTAAVMKNLDLVISVDTSVAHLAGALGVETWLALALVPDWRWLLDRTDSPWYKSVRLFRQTRLGDWPEVFGRMAEALRRRERQKAEG